jgi:hypothetical protein
LVLLSAAYPWRLDLQRLLLLDYLLVNSGDLDGSPASLHPATPHRSGEVLVRRDIVERGLKLFMSRGLIERHYDDAGITYAASDLTSTFLDFLRAGYTNSLRERADWVMVTFSEMHDHELRGLFDRNIGRWGSEFELESVLFEEES